MLVFNLITICIIYFLFLFPTKVLASVVVLNEIMANPLTDEKEWIEFYNSSSSDFSAVGFKLEEKTSSGNTSVHNLGDFTVPKLGYWTFDFSSSYFNDGGDTITIKDLGGNIIDSYSYGSSTDGKSFGRSPNGGSWVVNLDPTKASANSTVQNTPSPTPTQDPTP